jgi:DNA-binding MarR family transcriptional regulator
MPVSHKKSTTATPAPGTRPDRLDTRVLEALVGYNARRAWLAVSEVFAERMTAFGLKQVDFSVLSLLAHNAGATSRQLCSTLDILPPNLVSLIATMDSRGLIERRPHPHDGRAIGLYLTAAGEALVREAEQTVIQLEADASARLTPRERETLIRLLQKVYRPARGSSD